MFRPPWLLQLLSFFICVTFTTVVCGQDTRSSSSAALVMRKAKALLDEGHYQTAFASVSEYLSNHSAITNLSKVDLEALDFIRLAAGMAQGELPAVNRAIQLMSKVESPVTGVQLAYHLGHYYFRLAMFEDAIRFLEMTDRLYLSKDEQERVSFEKGVAYFSQKKFDNAKPYFKQLLDAGATMYAADVQYYLGFVAFSEQQYQEAQQLFLAIEKDQHYKLAVPFYLAYIFHETGQDAKAISYGETYLKAGDGLHNNEMLQLLASVYFNRGEQQKSVLLYEKAIASGTVLNPVQRFELGSGYHFTGKFTKAVEQLKPLSAGKDTVALQSMFILGDSYLQLNEKSNARTAFQYCIAGNLSADKKEKARFLLSKLSLDMGFEDQALKGLGDFVNDYPSSLYAKEANDLLLSYYARTNNFRQALVLLERIGNSNADYKNLAPRIFFGRGIELINDLQYEAALKMLTSIAAFKNTPFYGPSLFWRGELAMREEAFEKAIPLFQEYAKLPARSLGEANLDNTLYNLGYCYFELEEYAKAASFFERIHASNRNINSPLSREAMLRAADCAFMEKNTTKAKLLYTNIQKSPGYGADYAAFQLALIAGIKSPAEKISLLKLAEQQYPGSVYNPLIAMELADTYMSEEEFENAIPYLKKIPSLVEKDDEMIPESLLKLGIAFYNIDNIDEAIIQYKKLVSDFPASEQAAEAIESAKSLYVDSGRIEEYQQFLESGGKTMDMIQKDSLMFRFVQTTYADGKSQDSYKALDEYISKFPNGLFIAEVMNYKGELLIKDKNLRDAAVLFDQLAAKGTSRYQERALRQAGKLYFFEVKDYAASLGIFKQLSKLTTKPDVLVESLRGEVRAYYQLKQWKDGIDAANALSANGAANQDDKAFSAIVTGYAAQASGNFDQSNASFNTVLANNYSSLAAEARHQLAFNAFSMSNLAAAETAALACIENSGSYEFWITKSYLLLGDIFLQQKDFFNAKATLKSVVENCSIPALVADATEKLKAAELAEKTGTKK